MSQFFKILKLLPRLPELVKFKEDQMRLNQKQEWKIQNTFEIAKQSREFVRKHTEANIDLGYKPHHSSTVVLTGQVGGRDFVEIYSISHKDFEYFRQTLVKMNRKHQVKRIDGPIDFCVSMKKEIQF